MLDGTDYAPVAGGAAHEAASAGTHELGRRGEEVAAANLVSRGWTILERNWRIGCGEADIIARDPMLGDAAAVLIEVKTRRAHGDVDVLPECAVDEGKRRRYRLLAHEYLRRHPFLASVRFDTIAIRVDDGGYHLHQTYGAFGDDE